MASELRIPKAATEGRHAYRFGRGSDDNAFLTRGWGEPERGFVWSEGKCGAVSLPASDVATCLSVSLWGYVPRGAGPQELLLFVNGIFSGHFEIHEKTVVNVPFRSHDRLDTTELLFYIPSAISPAAAEGASDNRRLGVALAAIELSEDMNVSSL